MNLRRPMLAPSESIHDRLHELIYPVYISVKLDGIRCHTNDKSQPLSRTLKLIPNKFIQESFVKAKLPSGLDGELLVYDDRDKLLNYNDIQSQVMSKEGKPNFVYVIFDYVRNAEGYSFSDRLSELHLITLPSFCLRHNQLFCPNRADLDYYIKAHPNVEGFIIRSAYAPYKFGRSTVKEQYLLKYKLFEDSEARIVGMKEKYNNGNPQTTDERGLAKRSTHLANQYPAGVMGCLVVEDLKHPAWGQFEIGSGFTDADRRKFWLMYEKDFDKIVKYKYQKFGMKDKPRSPIYLGLRSSIDM